LFKLIILFQIGNQWSFVEDIVKEYFVTSKLTIENTINYFGAVVAFLVMLHVFACTWIWIGALEDQWMEGDDESYYEDKLSTYFQAFYFISTTMT